MIARIDEEQGLAFSVSPETGGELASLQVRWGARWVELLHRAGDFGAPAQGHWRGRAPWLFPAVGRSYTAEQLRAFAAGGEETAGSWTCEGKPRPMPIHGFVMDRPWQGLETREEEAVCRFVSDAATRAFYPFDFELTARYSFVQGGVRARLAVAASPRNAAPMPFSAGNHLTLALPFGSGASPGDCRLKTPARDLLELSAQSLLTGAKRPAELAKPAALAERPELRDAVLGGFEPNGRWVELSDPRSFGLRVSLGPLATEAWKPEAGAHLFVLYGDLEEGFFCVEPWYGGPNSLNEGRGLVRLPPGGSFEWQMTVAVLR